MKLTITLLVVAVLTPLTLFAQSPDAVAVAQAAPATVPTAPRLPQVQFDGATLHELVEALQARSKQAGHNPGVDPLNVVISPGLQEHRVPALSLRNVSPTEVLTVATTVLGLRLEPVTGDGGQTVAWLIKAPEPPAGRFTSPRVTTTPAGLPNATASSNPLLTPNSSVPYTVQLAGSAPSTDLFGSSSAPQTMSRVFGVASLISSERGDAKARELEQAEKLKRLLQSIEQMAADHGGKAQINAYNEMDLLVVKSADPGVLALIAEAIDAMKTNAAKDGSAGQARENMLRAEMNALKAELNLSEKEKAMQRQTLLDQIELLKASQKVEDAQRPKK